MKLRSMEKINADNLLALVLPKQVNPVVELSEGCNQGILKSEFPLSRTRHQFYRLQVLTCNRQLLSKGPESTAQNTSSVIQT